MKKILIGLITGIVISIPAGAFAWSSRQITTPLKAGDCANYNGSLYDCSYEVDKFSDGTTTCYVATQTGEHDPSISCIKQ